MTWAIWINFLPLSHGGSTWNLASVGLVVLEKIFEHTHILAHQNTTAESCSRWKVGGAGAGALQAKHYCIFVGGTAGLFFFFSIQWAFGFCGNVEFSAGDGPSQKCSLFKWDLLEWKKFPFFEEGSPEKWVVWVPWWWCWLISWPSYRWWFSREVKSRRIHCTMSRLILPAIYAGN